MLTTPLYVNIPIAIANIVIMVLNGLELLEGDKSTAYATIGTRSLLSILWLSR